MLGVSAENTNDHDAVASAAAATGANEQVPLSQAQAQAQEQADAVHIDKGPGDDMNANAFPSPTLVIVAIISLIIYVTLLRPKTNDRQQQRTNAPANHRQRAAAAPQQRNAQNTNWNASAGSSGYKLSDAAQEVLSQNMRLPPHVQLPVATISKSAGIGGKAVLVDGVVAFKYVNTDMESSSIQTADKATNMRKDRAKVLSKILDPHAFTFPPPRGSTIVISVQEMEIVSMPQQQASLQRFVQCMATYYNVFVMVHMDLNQDDGKAKSTWKRDALGSPFPHLPTHRLIPTSTTAGRVALVRQLQTVEHVIDFDPQVQSELTRFGYKVYTYDPNVGLGDQMFPAES